MSKKIIVLQLVFTFVGWICTCQTLLAQQITVHGTVTDAQTGKTLQGAGILVIGTSIGIATDSVGYYSLTVPSPQDTLRFSYIGYQTRIVPIDSRSKIDIAMKRETISGKQLVVTAFGNKQRAENVVGAVSTLNVSNLSQAPTSNLTTALAGRVAGLISFQRTGEPGRNNAHFFIRGVSTFGYRTHPLILIDGIESSVTQLARLQPDNIANFSILKDATATAVYGSRAANGVILIKTKEGHQQGPPRIGIRMESSISMPTMTIDFAKPVKYMRLYNKAVLSRNPLGVTPFSQRKIDKTAAGADPYLYPAVNWRDALFKNYALNQRFNLSVSGGGSVATYYVAGSFDNTNGLLEVNPINDYNSNISLKSYSLRANVNIHLTKNTQMEIKLGDHFDNYTGPLKSGSAIYREMVHTSPVRFPPYYPRTQHYQYVNHVLFGSYYNKDGTLMNNPFADLVKGYRNYSRSNLNAQFGINHNFAIIKGLNIRATMFVSRHSFFQIQRSTKPFFYQASSYNRQTKSINLSLLNEKSANATLNYDPSGKKVRINFKFRSQLKYKYTIAKKNNVGGLLVFRLQNRLIGSPKTLQASLPRRDLGISGRASYNYDERYYINLNFGYNGSERFAKAHRFGFFPSVGIAWNVSNESFWNPLKNILSTFRIRATYGIVGNSAISNSANRFLYLSVVNLRDPGHGYGFGLKGNHFLPGMSISRYANPHITWQKAKKLDLGIKIGLYNHMSLKTDYFRQNRYNILQHLTSIPPALGPAAPPQANIGSAISHGFEASLTYQQFIGNDFFIKFRGNFTYATSKYTHYSEQDYSNIPWKSRIGKPISQPYGYIATRLFIDNEEAANSPPQFGQYGAGDIKYRDINGDQQITPVDKVPIGYPTIPEINYGFGFSVGYKNLDLSAFFEGLAHESFFINASATAPFIGNTQLLKVYAQNHWSRSNQNIYALWPKFSAKYNAGGTNNFKRSTWWLRNGTFIRLRAVEIGYSLPQSLLNSISVRKIRIYLNARNLFTFSKFKLWDPEMGGNGLAYPIQKVYNVGVKINF